MLSRYARAVMSAVFTPVARALVRRGVSPDVVTVLGTLGVVLAALLLLPAGHLVVGPLVITAFVLSDTLDGVMARMTGRSGPWGAFLDSTLDRVGDAAIFLGVALWFLGDGASPAAGVLALVCLVLGSVVSYAKARAEGLGMTADVGIAARADRLVAVLAATFFVGLGAPTLLLVVVLAVLAVLSAVTIGQRVATVRRQASALARRTP
ncbi:CDP-alcohol phosphatidyltransferase family protein [Pseudokineococcus marinus]|uniref:Phosphatidylinositol phosphate synthase n=1 Tax=Pseudokineococcus marinus TaxID=351215 RepID=A0A849C1Y5_9ACTN|nr:CDP-alcohol phosphatidyltransferase family protein [Pseudokineococcus marinus]NNH23688.1 CDP-alcohol phosphatidyltransferase family protein [Pseudokineococcus marinus]